MDARPGVTWTENTVVVLQAVVDMRGMVLPDDAFELLLAQLDRHAAYFAASLKFAALMMSLITKHAKQVTSSFPPPIKRGGSVNSTCSHTLPCIAFFY
jgi:hypothetical protein